MASRWFCIYFQNRFQIYFVGINDISVDITFSSKFSTPVSFSNIFASLDMSLGPVRIREGALFLPPSPSVLMCTYTRARPGGVTWLSYGGTHAWGSCRQLCGLDPTMHWHKKRSRGMKRRDGVDSATKGERKDAQGSTSSRLGSVRLEGVSP